MSEYHEKEIISKDIRIFWVGWSEVSYLCCLVTCYSFLTIIILAAYMAPPKNHETLHCCVAFMCTGL